MSAPIRSLESRSQSQNNHRSNHTTRDSSNNRKAQQQPQRRRRNGAEEVSLRQTFTSVQIRDCEDDESGGDYPCERKQNGDSSDRPIRRSSARSASKSNPSRSSRPPTFSCDKIVTLVSLLDSGASDSEQEDNQEQPGKRGRGVGETTIGVGVEKPPTLRKAGKSGGLMGEFSFCVRVGRLAIFRSFVSVLLFIHRGKLIIFNARIYFLVVGKYAMRKILMLPQ